MTRLDDELTAVVLYAMQNDLLLAAKWISGRVAKAEKAARPKRKRKARIMIGGHVVRGKEGEVWVEPERLEEVGGD